MSNATKLTDWMEIAFEPPVVRRALCFAVIVGTVLILINHGDAVWAGDITSTRLIKMAATAAVPYLVSTFSSVGAIRAMRCGSGDRET